jgi:uncharacterized protein (TIGR03546 family)
MGLIVRMIGDAFRNASMHRQPSAIALALAFGISIGLMPKDNLMVFSLVAAACFLRMNYLLAITIGLVLSFGIPLRGGAPWTDGLTHEIGKRMLESPLLQSVWLKLAHMPILPWLRWNNSVVLGSVGFGLASYIPLYLATAIISRQISRFQSQNRVDTMVQEMADYQTQIKAEQNKRQLLKATIESNSERRRTVKKRSNQLHRIDETVPAELVKPNIVDVRPEPTMSMITSEAPSHASSAVLHETVIEIVRYRPKTSDATTHRDDPTSSSRDQEFTASPMNPHAIDQHVSLSKHLTTGGSKQPETTIHIDDHSSQSNQNTFPMVQGSSTEKPREEALRYLLWHLSGMHRQPTRSQESVS